MPDYARHLQDLQTIMKVSRAMSSERDLDRLLNLIIEAATRLIDADRSSLFLVDNEHKELLTRIAQNAEMIRLPMGRGIAGMVATTGNTINIASAYDDARFDPDHDRRSGYKTRSILCMPLLTADNAVVGVIQALNRHSEYQAPQGDLPDEDQSSEITAFTSYDEQVLAALCSQAAVAISNAQLLARDRERQILARDMELARSIQLGLLPSASPQVPGWSFATWAKSCDHTGGDYYDFIVPNSAASETGIRSLGLSEHCFDVVVGDVSGHGIGAAMLMSTARAFLRALYERHEPLEKTVKRLNRLLEQDMGEDTFMSMAVCRLDDQGGCHYVAAGHEPPLIYRRASGTFDELDSTGLLLGMLDDSEYVAQEVPQLQRGDLLLLFTDGIWESPDPEKSQTWGLKALREVVARNADKGAQVVCDAIVASVSEHLGGASPHDDMTLVVVERLMDIAILPDEPPTTGESLFTQTYPSRLDRKQAIIDELTTVVFQNRLVVEDDRHWLQLCLDEALVNAMLHGNEGDPSLSLTVAIHRDGGRWGMTISDEGEGFDQSAVPNCDDPESLLLEHGRGIHIMRSWFDQLIYYRNGSCAAMWRKIPADSGTRN